MNNFFQEKSKVRILALYSFNKIKSLKESDLSVKIA